MEEILESIEDILALSESVGVLVVAREYGAGEVSPQSLQRLATMITGLCAHVIDKIDQTILNELEDDHDA